MKKYIFLLWYLLISYTSVFAAVPEIHCGGLPGCEGGSVTSEQSVYGIIGNFISLMIQYTAVIAVIAVMIGGIMYLVSGGNDERVGKAKKVIIWAMVGVFVSILAWSVINILNNFVI